MQSPGTPTSPYRGTSPSESASRNSPYVDQTQLSPAAGHPGQMQSGMQPIALQPKQLSAVRQPTVGTLGQQFMNSQNVVSGIGHVGQSVGQYIVGAGGATQPRLAICFSQGQLTAGQIGQPQLGQTSSSPRLALGMYRHPTAVPVSGQQAKMGASHRQPSSVAQQTRMNNSPLQGVTGHYQPLTAQAIGQPQVLSADQGTASSLAFRPPLLGSPIQAAVPANFAALQVCNIRPDQNGKQSRPTTSLQQQRSDSIQMGNLMNLGQHRSVPPRHPQPAQFIASPGNVASVSPLSPLSPRLGSPHSGTATSVTQIASPQFLSPSGAPTVSPQFLRSNSTPVSPVAVPLSPGIFQVTGNMGQPHLIPVQTPTTGPQIQSAMYFSGQHTGLINTSSVTPISSITLQTPPTSRPGGGVSSEGVGLGAGRGVLYTPTISGMGPVILMNPPQNTDISDQPTDLSKKSTNQQTSNIETTVSTTNDAAKKSSVITGSPSVEPRINGAELNLRADHKMNTHKLSDPESFHEEYLKLKQNKGGNQVNPEPPELEQESKLVIDEKGDAVNGSTIKRKTEKEGGKETVQRDDKYKSIDTGDYTEDGVPVEFDDPEFVWEEYLQETGASAVPPTAFKHVECSLQSGFVKGMKLEVPNKCNPNTYWVASVVMTCGPLLRLRYDGYEEDSCGDFWCDLSTSEIHPIGWCAQNGQNLQPPEDIKYKFSDWREFLMNSLTGARTAPSYLLDKTTGTTPIDQLKSAICLELQDILDPRQVWLVKIIENVGGRLYLRYEGAESGINDFWMFYLHHRLHPVGWAKAMGYHYKPPKALTEKYVDVDWVTVGQTAINEAESTLLPVDVFKDQIEIEPHKFVEGYKLEAVNPESRNHICPATVVKIINDRYFLVEIDDLRGLDERKVIQFCCHANSLGIFPVQWCQCKGIRLTHPIGWIKPDFNWTEYLSFCGASAAPDRCFHMKDLKENEFERGMKLEAVNPDNPNQICAATITKILGPLLWIHLDNSAKVIASHIEPVDSFNLYPVGWCESNGYQLKPPRKTGYGTSHHRRPSAGTEKISGNNLTTEAYNHMKSSGYGGSSCPKIFFNHRCFSGPYLSKGRIAELPKCVGPGPILLVMKEVLSMLISVAYKSCRVLKELQMEGKPNPSMQQQTLKAKYKGKSYRAQVEICRSVDQLEEFCRNVCIKLECCPYLFSPQYIEDTCPEDCQQLTKTKYNYTYGKKKKKIGRPPGGHTNLENGPKAPGKRGRKRKRYLLIQKKSHPSYEYKKQESHSVSPDMFDDKESLESGYKDDLEGDLQESKKNGLKRKYTHHLPPPTDMKTRGAKLPKYSFERKTHKKILLSQTSPTLKATRHRSHAHSPPPVVKSNHRLKEGDLNVENNPLYWSVNDVINFIKTTDCSHLARIIKEQEIDGQALLLLSLATIQEHLELKLGPAVKLCHQIERVKIAFFNKFA